MFGRRINNVRKKFLLLTVGLPGVGKTTLVRHLVRLFEDTVVYESDVVRKMLAGYPPDATLPRHMYTSDLNGRTFSYIRRNAKVHLVDGRSVIVDATFTRAEYRRPFVDLGLEVGVPTVGLHVFASEEVVMSRLKNPRAVSDADYEVYLALKETAELPPDEIPYISVDGTGDPVSSALRVFTWIRGLIKAL